MESLTPVSRYKAQISKKRVLFPGGSSSSGFKEVEVLEVSSPINGTSKPNSSKQKEVTSHEIIDVEMEEDYGDVMLIDGEVDRSGKGKEALSNFSAGLCDLENDGSGSDGQMSNNEFVDDHNSNAFYGEDEWIDTYYDDIIYDDYADSESYFDNVDIPPGVEAPFPWLPGSSHNNSKVPITSASTISSSKFDQNGADLSPDLSSSQSSMLLKPIQIKDLTTSPFSKKGTQAASQADPSSHSSWVSLTNKNLKELSQSLGNSIKKSSASHVYSNPHYQFPSGPILPNHIGYPKSSMPSNMPVHRDFPPGTGSNMPMWQDFPLNIQKPSMGPSVFLPMVQDSANDQNRRTTRAEQINLDEAMQKFDLFKKFDTVEDYSDHHFCKYGSSSKQAPKGWSKKIQEEWKILEKDLPETIFVRVYESRMDLLRAVIMGAEGTPYHDGLFFFDVFFPSTYPNVPPHVHYHSGGLRINPNLYECGKVCLSLLNTWSGSEKEKWLPGVSTMLQVLVSIQGLILNAKPFFNEPGYENMSGTEAGEKESSDYNETTFIYSLRTMVYHMRKPPKYFEPFVVGHFCKHARDILVSCKSYLDGAQVGCLVKGGVQDVDEGDQSCSRHFKTRLAGFIPILVNAISEIGAKDCEEFLSLAQRKFGPATTAPRFIGVNKLG